MTYEKQKHYWLYVLKLEGGKYYIGVTSRTPEERFKEHKNSYYGAEWTKIHKPLRIEQSKDLGVTTYNKAEEYENKVTRHYIKNYGIDSVRGGNLSYRGRMVRRFGYFWRYEDWDLFFHAWILVVLLIISSLYIALDAIYRH
jgi:predicted GIY-YIG superfamily endonuclease